MNETPVRTVRVPDNIWDAAAARANRENVSMAAVIRKLLSQYARS